MGSMLPLGWGVGVPRVDEPRVDEPRVDEPRVDEPRVGEARLVRTECITLLISSRDLAGLSSSAARDLGQPLRKAFD